MSNYSPAIRVKRWVKFLAHYINERLCGLDFSMVYVGDLQRHTAEFHGYSMTDAGDMKRMLQSIPLDVSQASFLDIGCGKGMCPKCAVESGYKKVAGLDLDQHLLTIARRNMMKLKMDADCIYANAVDYDGYAKYDVFYFYNPFGRSVFEQVIQKISESQIERNREIWVVYYHPVFAELFENAGFVLQNEIHDRTRDTTTRIYCYPKRKTKTA